MSTKIKKPYKDFPLYPHASGQWCKKVRGKVYYFGTLNKPNDALQKWLNQKDYLLSGRTPPRVNGSLSVADLCKRFLLYKKRMVESGEIKPRTYKDYERTCRHLEDFFGDVASVELLQPEQFGQLRHNLSQRLSPVPLKNAIIRVRSVFKYAHGDGLIDTPVRYGQQFDLPSKSVIRRDRATKPKRMFTKTELLEILDESPLQIRAMVLLGINCGFGNMDVGSLPVDAIDWENGFHNFARPKTGIARRCPLWPITQDCLALAISHSRRYCLPEIEHLCFATKYRQPWAKDTYSAISHEFRKVLDKVGVHRRYVTFYSLRHMFETIGGDTGDQVAVNHIMGHVDSSMAAEYRESIADERLVRVTDAVRRWVFG